MLDTDFLKKIEQVRKEQSAAIPAQRLVEKLQRAYTYIDSYQRRWFWELVQNANDACNEDKKIDIVLSVENNEITFKHNGNPFSARDVMNIIFPNSDKSDEELEDDDRSEKNGSMIGKFGSGLISTHILSSKIELKGIIKDEETFHSFNMELNRSEISKPYLIEELSREFETFQQSISFQPNFSMGDISASFTYHLNEPLPNIPRFVPTDEYLQYLYDVTPYTMCFLTKLGSVTIEDKRLGLHTYSCVISNRTDSEICFSINKDEKITERKFIYFATDKAQTVFDYRDNSIFPYPDGVPKLFCGLPMIGTEKTGLPIIINSIYFVPSDERDSAELIPGPQYNENIEIISQAAELYRKVLNYVESNKLSGVYYLARISHDYKCNNTASKQQFEKKFVEPSVEYIKTKKIIRSNESNQYIDLRIAKIPYIDDVRISEELYELASYVRNADLPIIEDYKYWVETLDFSIFREMTYKLPDLLSDVEKIGKINLIGEDQLHKILTYASKSNEYQYLLKQKAIIPTQIGNLQVQSKVYADDNIPSKLKSIYNLVHEEPVESFLLVPLFNDLDIIQIKKTESDIASSIDTALKEKYKSIGNVSTLLSPINELFDWIKEQHDEYQKSKETLRALFPWFYEKKESLLVEALPDKNRENVLRIAQSDNLEKLSLLANCDAAILSEVMNKYDAMLSAAQQGLSKKEQEEWNEIARRKALIKLKKDYNVPNISDTHGSIINGVVDKDGISHIVLIKSAAKGIIYMEPTEWEVILRDRNAIFMVYDGKEVYAQKASILFQCQDLLQLTFSTENLLYDERVKKILSVFSEFDNTHMNLRSLNMIGRGEDFGDYNFWDNNPDNNSFETGSID